ncbi:MAG: hypothetical protein WAZ18_03655 [Alphaproteobacteria bacterium]
MTTSPFCFANHMLNVAAGCTVDACAYGQWEHRLNMMKVKALGEGFLAGWLHNLMARITPLTARDTDDYLMMADLFITDATQATALLQKMSCDMSAFATAAGLYFSPTTTPPEMALHKAVYQQIASRLGEKFGMETPAPFACATIKAVESEQSQRFIREFMNETFERPAARVGAEDYLD